MPSKTTTSGQVLDPEVLADMASAELVADLKFTPFAQTDDTLEGRPGSEVDFPAWNYIGDAVDLTEDEDMETTTLTYGVQKATIKEYGKAVSITDMAMLTGYGDPYGESVKQLGLAMANKLDNDILQVLSGAQYKATTTATVSGLQDALDNFNDEGDATIALVISPKAAGKLRLDAGDKFLAGSELGAQRIASGVYGEVLGAQIIRSRKLNDNAAYLIKTSDPEDTKPAVKLMLKRGVNIEAERKPGARKTNLYATAVGAPYLYNPSKVVQITFSDITSKAGTTGAPADKTVDAAPTNVDEDHRVGRNKKKASSVSSSASVTPGKV